MPIDTTHQPQAQEKAEYAGEGQAQAIAQKALDRFDIAGGPGHQIANAPLLKKCQEMPGVHLVELPVDYSENDRILNHEIKERSQKI